MITYDEAVRIVAANVEAIEAETVSLHRACGRFLSEDVIATLDSPRFHNSAVDGYALHASVLATHQARVVFEIQAGAFAPRPLAAGECARVLTGAPIPSGTAAVVMQEDCLRQQDEVVIKVDLDDGENVRRCGEDFESGAVLLPRGTLIGPVQSAIIASAGAAAIKVHGKPRVAVMTSGNEIAPMEVTDYGSTLVPNSNAYGICAAIERLGLACQVRHVPDDPVATRKIVTDLLEHADVLLTCGGVSVGSYDYLKDVFRECGIQERFWSVAIKPGKPIYFGTLGRKVVFGLPGNPVSAMVTYYLFARSSIMTLMGHPAAWPEPIRVRLSGGYEKRPGRMEFLRGKLENIGTEAVARPAGGRGSHQLAGLAFADCLIHFPLEASALRDGDVVEVTKLNWELS